MKDLSILFGIKFSLPVYVDAKSINSYYKSIIKPFFQIVDKNKKIRLFVYFSGNILTWLENSAPEFIIILKELYNNRQIDFLAAGFYEPAFQFLNPNERALQLDLHIQAIRKITNKRPKGFFLVDGSWESNFPSILNNLNISYTFINDITIKYSGYNDDSLFNVFITEDQGRRLFLFPFNSEMSSSFFNISVEDYIMPLKEFEFCENSLLSIFIDGIDLIASKDNFKWFEDFSESLLSEGIDFSLPLNYLKNSSYKKVYIQSSCNNDCAGKMFYNGERISYEVFFNQFGNSDFLHFINRGNYRNFLSKYEEANRIYCRMKFTSNAMMAIKSDKVKRKECLYKLLKGQSANVLRFAYDLGVYEPLARINAYEAFLDAEKAMKLKSVSFKEDFDFDGLDEIVFLGQTINTFFHQNGGSIFELDYNPMLYNYVNNIKNYKEYSKNSFNDNNRKKLRKFDLFQDFFKLEDDTTINLSNTKYELVKFDLDRKNLNFSLKIGKLGCRLNKNYNVKKNSVIVEYNICNESDELKSFIFSSELNLFLYDFFNKTDISKIEDDKEINLKGGDSAFKHIKHLKISDNYKNTILDIQTSKACRIDLIPRYSDLTIDNEDLKIFQFTSFITGWNINLKPNSNWNVSIELNIGKL